MVVKLDLNAACRYSIRCEVSMRSCEKSQIWVEEMAMDIVHFQTDIDLLDVAAWHIKRMLDDDHSPARLRKAIERSFPQKGDAVTLPTGEIGKVVRKVPSQMKVVIQVEGCEPRVSDSWTVKRVSERYPFTIQLRDRLKNTTIPAGHPLTILMGGGGSHGGY